MVTHNYSIHTDGGARGNPGPAAIGFTIEGSDLQSIAHGEVIGETTNNVAEYTAVIKALAKLKSVIGSAKAKEASVAVSTDSELLVKQMTGIYKVKDENIGKLFIQIHNAQQDFHTVSFAHVPREKNKEADRMVNEALDGQDVPELDL